MADVRTLVVDVSDLLQHPGTSRRLVLSGEVAGVGVDMAHLAAPDVRVDLLAESIVEGILVSGTVATQLEIRCSRCLTEVTTPLQTDVEEIFSKVRDDEDTYPVSGGEIDLEPMVRDAVVLAMPLNPLCRPDCAGLCPRCGQDLNVADCGHRGESGDPRWEPLSRLREAMGG